MKRFGMALLALALVACSSNPFAPPPTPTPPPPEIPAPTLTGYKTYPAKDVQGQLAILIELATAATQPEIAVMVGVIDQMSQCYQEQGALQMLMYTKEDDALSSGVLTIVDQTRLTDPMVLATCTIQAGNSRIKSAQVEPCAANYTIDKEGKTFYIAYAATTLDLCTALCTNLEGCTAHR